MLTDILAYADERATVAESRIEQLLDGAMSAPPVRDLVAALTVPGLGVVAEIKRRSPSVGAIDMDIDPAAQAVEYVNGGADAISVLTEPKFFAGSLDDLRSVRSAVDVPVLRKDFTRNAAQIWEARAAGADAVLLIVATLDDSTLAELVAVASEVGVAAIVEAHTVHEADRAVAAGASIVGINNRDLSTFATDLAVAELAAPRLPANVVRIAESGVSDASGAQRMAVAGYDAILVGEALVRSPDPAGLVSSLKAAS